MRVISVVNQKYRNMKQRLLPDSLTAWAFMPPKGVHVPHGSPPKREETIGGRVARRCHRASYVASSRLSLRNMSHRDGIL